MLRHEQVGQSPSLGSVQPMQTCRQCNVWIFAGGVSGTRVGVGNWGVIRLGQRLSTYLRLESLHC